MFITKEVADFLNVKLALPAKGDEQDWDIELANKDRVKEFTDYLNTAILTNEQKFALMSLIVASYEDLLVSKNKLYTPFWHKIGHILNSEKHLYQPIIDYWTQDKTTEGFLITSVMLQV